MAALLSHIFVYQETIKNSYFREDTFILIRHFHQNWLKLSFRVLPELLIFQSLSWLKKKKKRQLFSPLGNRICRKTLE